MQIVSENFASDGKEFACKKKKKNLPAIQKTWIQSLGGKIPWRREWLPTPEFQGQRSLAGYSLWWRKEQNMSQWLTLSLFNTALEQCQATTNWSVSQIQCPCFCVLYEFKISLNECILNSQVSLYKKFSALLLSPQNLRNILFGLLSERICASLLLSVSTTVK